MNNNFNTALSNDKKWELSNFSLDQCKEAITLLEKRIRQLTNADYQSYTEKHIRDLGLSNRAIYALGAKNLTTIGAILEFGLNKLEYLEGCGKKTEKEIREAIMRDIPKQE